MKSIMDHALGLFYKGRFDLDRQEYGRAATTFHDAIESLAAGWEAEVRQRKLVEEELAAVRLAVTRVLEREVHQHKLAEEELADIRGADAPHGKGNSGGGQGGQCQA